MGFAIIRLVVHISAYPLRRWTAAAPAVQALARLLKSDQGQACRSEQGAFAGAPLRRLRISIGEPDMKSITIRAALVLAVAMGAATLLLAPGVSQAQQSSPKSTTVKAGKGEKVCRVKLKYSGETRAWLCKTEEPCCVWHEINYVKCGSTVTGCL
jgi:hypothetical protein